MADEVLLDDLALVVGHGVVAVVDDRRGTLR